MPVRDLLIVGAGPSGLATAIAAKQHGLDYASWTRACSSTRSTTSRHSWCSSRRRSCSRSGACRSSRRTTSPPGSRRSATTGALSIPSACRSPFTRKFVRSSERTTERFVVTSTGERAATRVSHARAVVLAIGYYDLPNYLGFPGEDLPHVSHYFTDAHPYHRQRVVVVGGKNSAAEAALELFRGGAHVTLVHRRATLGDSIKYWVRPDIENRIKEGSIAARFESRVVEIRPTEVIIERKGERRRIPAEGVFLLTGYHPDAELMTARWHECHRGVADADARSGDLREQRAEPVPRGGRRGGSQHRQHLHRERPLSRRADREGHCRQAVQEA